MALPRLSKPLGRHQNSEAKLSLETWFESELGQGFMAKQKNILDEVLPRLFGYHLIYTGMDDLSDLVSSSPIKHKVILSLKSTQATLNGSAHQLAILSNSTDVMVLHHSLDFEKDPSQVLREAGRVVLPNGNLIIIGFNPWSFWGLWRSFLFRSTKAPWNARFISPYRLAEWLNILDFDVTACESGFYKPPVSRFNQQESLNWFETLGALWFAQRGGFYILLAKKRVSCITPIHLQQKRKRSQVLPITAAGRFSSKETQEGGSSCETR